VAHKHTKGPKRGQCDACPATKALARVEVAPGKKLVLCIQCRNVLRRLEKEQRLKREAEIEHVPEGSLVDAGDNPEAPTVDHHDSHRHHTAEA
jgi:hypothetical protein